MASERAAAARFIFVVLLLDVLGIGLIIPVLPGLVTDMVGGDEGVAAGWYGPLTSTFAVASFLAGPILGGLSDRFGRRPVLLISLAGYALDYLLLALAPTLGWLFVARFIGGVTGGTIATASAYLADISTPETRARNFGLIGAAFGLGFILGPAAGGLLGSVAPRLPFFAAAVVVTINVVYGVFVLPESLPPERRRAISWRDFNPFGPLALLVRLPGVLPLVGAYFVMALAQRGLESVWVLSTRARFGWEELANGLTLTLVGVMSAFVQGWWIGRFVRSRGERAAVLFGFAAAAIGHFVLGAAPWPVLFLLGVPLATMNGLAGPTIQARISAAAPPSRHGAVQGALAALVAFTAILAPLPTNALLTAVTRPEAPTWLAGAPFLLTGSLLLVAFGLGAIGLRASPAPTPFRPASG